MFQTLHGAVKLIPYIPGGELDVEHGGVDVGVAHETHEGRKRDACPNHIGSESVSEAMGIGLGDLGETAVMAKQRAEASGCQGISPVWTFEDNKDGGRVSKRPFHAQVAVENPDGLWVERQEPLPISFPLDADFTLSETKVLELEVEGLARTQTVEEHEGDQAQIAIGSKTAPELGDFRGRERNHDTAGDFHSQCAQYPASPSIAEGRGFCITGPRAVGSRGDLGSMVETVETVRHTDAVVDRLSSGLRLVVHLEADVIEEHRLVESGELNRGSLKPTCKV